MNMEKRLSDVYFVEYEVALEKSNGDVEILISKRIFTIDSVERLGIGLVRSIIDIHGNGVSNIKILDIRAL